MRTIVHLSDLHFGRFDDNLIAPLLAAIHEIAPDLVVISGDLTQRARPREFHQARLFLDRVVQPLLVVPGNHDVPLFDIVEKIVDPLRRYRRHITTDLAPVFEDEEMIAVGINSARRVPMQSGGGRLNMRQVEWAVARFAAVDASVTKIVVTHHPFDLPKGYGSRYLIGRAHPAMRALAAVGADFFVAGHLHRSHVGATAERYKIAGHSALVVQAGTLSTRQRGELNAFNVIHIRPRCASVAHHTWNPDQRRFARSWSEEYRRGADGWAPATSTQ